MRHGTIYYIRPYGLTAALKKRGAVGTHNNAFVGILLLQSYELLNTAVKQLLLFCCGQRLVIDLFVEVAKEVAEACRYGDVGRSYVVAYLFKML